jgi:GNAT superfamily N-acetyltransferase
MKGAVEIIDANLRAAMRFFGYATGKGAIVEYPGVVAIDSGLSYGVFNLVFLTAPCQDLASAITAPMRHFQGRSRRWSFWLCEDLLDHAARRTARKTFNSQGFRSLSHPPGMLAERVAPPLHALPPIEYRRVSTRETRRDFFQISAVCFDIPPHIARTVYETDSAWSGDYRGYVAYDAGRPVATVAIVPAAEALGVYSLGTLPEHRRLGYGEALLRAALADVSRETGFSRTVLQSTDAGLRLYRSMGYREVTRYAVYLSE